MRDLPKPEPPSRIGWYALGIVAALFVAPIAYGIWAADWAAGPRNMAPGQTPINDFGAVTSHPVLQNYHENGTMKDLNERANPASLYNQGQTTAGIPKAVRVP